MSKPKKGAKPTIVLPGKMTPEQLQQWQLVKTRSRQFADRRKESSRRACRGNTSHA